jgi:predicted nucleic acid-binding protein
MKKSLRLPNGEEQAILDRVQVRLIKRAELAKFNRLLDEHHYLGSQQAVGERLQYVALSREGEWLALLVFSAAAKHLKHRDQWIGSNSTQRHRRLSLVTNNSRFLILPQHCVPIWQPKYYA